MKWILIIIAFFLFIFLISNSSSSSNIVENDSPATTTNSDYYPDEDFESEQTEEDVDTNYDQLEFNGYPCTDDCSGHEAGYEWAEENGITQDDVDNYSGNSDSFMEGMQSYVDEN